MPRAVWSGSISFGLVNIPVKLYPAVSRKSVSFHQIDRRTGGRIRYRKVSEVDEREVPASDIVKGYDVGGGRYVTVEPDELAALDPLQNRTIEIAQFIDAAEIDPIFYDAAYHVAPDRSAKPYALLVRAMEDAGRIAIARFVLRSREHLAAIRPREGALLLSTLVYADEIVPLEKIDGFSELAGIELSERELAMAVQLIEALTEPFEPERYHDTYREKVLELIAAKQAGAEPAAVTPATGPAADVVDIIAALEASVQAAKEARARHPAARAADGTTVTGAEPAPDAEPGEPPAAATA